MKELLHCNNIVFNGSHSCSPGNSFHGEKRFAQLRLQDCTDGGRCMPPTIAIIYVVNTNQVLGDRTSDGIVCSRIYTQGI